jgi:hypothetical protein
MASYTCIKCGEKVSSKCINQRSVFVTNHDGALLSHFLRVDLSEADSPQGHHVDAKLSITWNQSFTKNSSGTVSTYTADEPIERGQIGREMVKSLVAHLQDMLESSMDSKFDPPTIEVFMCEHEYKIDAGECLFGCCKA